MQENIKKPIFSTGQIVLMVILTPIIFIGGVYLTISYFYFSAGQLMRWNVDADWHVYIPVALDIVCLIYIVVILLQSKKIAHSKNLKAMVTIIWLVVVLSASFWVVLCGLYLMWRTSWW